MKYPTRLLFTILIAFASNNLKAQTFKLYIQDFLGNSPICNLAKGDVLIIDLDSKEINFIGGTCPTFYIKSKKINAYSQDVYDLSLDGPTWPSYASLTVDIYNKRFGFMVQGQIGTYSYLTEGDINNQTTSNQSNNSSDPKEEYYNYIVELINERKYYEAGGYYIDLRDYLVQNKIKDKKYWDLGTQIKECGQNNTKDILNFLNNNDLKKAVDLFKINGPDDRQYSAIIEELLKGKKYDLAAEFYSSSYVNNNVLSIIQSEFSKVFGEKIIKENLLSSDQVKTIFRNHITELNISNCLNKINWSDLDYCLLEIKYSIEVNSDGQAKIIDQSDTRNQLSFKVNMRDVASGSYKGISFPVKAEYEVIYKNEIKPFFVNFEGSKFQKNIDKGYKFYFMVQNGEKSLVQLKNETAVQSDEKSILIEIPQSRYVGVNGKEAKIFWKSVETVNGEEISDKEIKDYKTRSIVVIK